MQPSHGLTGAFLVLLAPALAIAEPAALRFTETTYTHKDGSVPATVIENGFFAATLVPDLGGRILGWVDKKTGTELVYDAGYGGMLDDHDARFRLPYAAEWL